MPAGDSYGILRLRFEPSMETDFLGSPTYFLRADMQGFEHEAFLSMAVYAVEGDEARWGATTFTSERGGGGVGIGGEGPAERLFVVALHATSPGILRLGIPPRVLDDIPPDTVDGVWLASGEAAVAYYVQQPFPIDADWPFGSPRTHGMTVASPSPPNELLGGPSLVVGSAHDAPDGSIVASSSFVFGAGAVGVERIAWTAGEETTSVVNPFAHTVAAGVVAFHVANDFAGPTELVVDVAGVQALPTVVVTHVTVPFDLASLGLKQTPKFSAALGLPSPILSPTCMVVSPRAACG